MRLRVGRPNNRLAHFSIGEVRAARDSASILARREVVDTLVTVTMRRQGEWARLDSQQVVIDWVAA